MKTLKNAIKDRLNIPNSDGLKTLKQRLQNTTDDKVFATDEHPIKAD